MKTKMIRLKIALVTLTLGLIVACSPSKPEIFRVNPAFGKYISAYTSGMVTRKANIRIELAESQVKLLNDQSNVSSEEGNEEGEAVLVPSDTTVLQNIFQFEPALEGRAVWVSDRVIEFIPSETLPSGQLYTVDFDLDRVAEVPGEFENFRFQFSTYQQMMFVSQHGLNNYDDYNLDWQRMEGSITVSDFEDKEKLAKTLTATQNGKNLPITVESDYYETNKYYFYVDSIQRFETQSQVILSWDGESIQSVSKGSKEIPVSALGDFSVSQVNVRDREDQYVELTFSEPIAANQNLNGIITIDGIPNLTYSIDFNKVSVYLPHRIVGDKVLHITDGIKNIRGHNMNRPSSHNLEFNEPKPLVRIKGEGSILPNSQGLIFPFEAISLRKVDVRVIKIFEHNVHHFLQVNDLSEDDGLTRFGKVIAEKTIALDYDKAADLKEWNKHVIDLSKLIEPELGAIYRVAIKFKKEYAICNCEDFGADNSEDNDYDEWSENEPVDEEFPDWNEKDWHGYGFGGGYDSWYYYNDDYSPCQKSYYSGKAVGRNILASDLGLVFKLDENKLSHAFVSNMLTTEPIPNAEVQYFDYTKQLIASGMTNAEGMLDIKLTKKPFLMIAKYGKQRGYLKLLDGQTNSLSKFDVEGEVVQKGVKGFIYGERGVWRPGDSLYLNFMLEDKLKKLPANHPVKFELRNPSGQLVYEVTKTKHVNGLYDFATKTSTEAGTGNYTAIVKVGNRTFTKNLKVETVKPNRLKIYMDIMHDTLLSLKAKWLHGAIAKNLNANVSLSLRQQKTKFDKLKNYEFDSPLRSFKSDDEVVYSGNLNDKGEASIHRKWSQKEGAPGMLQATYFTKVFEEGGDFSIDRVSVPYSPFRTYVGIRKPKGDNYDHTLETGKTHEFDIATVSEKGSPVDANRLQVKVYKIEWRWWYEKDYEDLANYMARTGTIVIRDTVISTKNGKADYRFKINYPEWGRYLIVVTDLDGKHQTGTTVNIDWPYWNRANRKNTQNANMLNFSCDKESYTKGETVKISFPSPSEGRALISVETSNKVLKKYWIKTQKGETTHEFQTTGEMSPNAFVHVTMIQPHANTKNDLPIRMYGVVPIMVDDPETHITPKIVMADEIRPESTINVKVKEEKGRKMSYTLALVDEGLLDLTSYKTPQPWNTFYAREALGVKTWDMYDDVIGAYSGKLDKLLSIGGDGEGDRGKGAKASRFKPMVIHLGPFELEAGQEKNHKIDIPNYVGSVRVMVVAHDEGAYGSAEKTVAVKKPLMLLATLPRVLGPGEEVSLPVNVFAMEKNIKDVKITIETNDFFQATGSKEQSIKFKEPGDEVVNFKLKIAEKIGIAKVKITAVCDGERATQEIEIDVRTPNPKVVEGSDLVIEPGKSSNLDLLFKGITGTNKATIEFSTIPAIGLEKRLDYLMQYPHGCIEQTTSAAFPQLLVSNLMEPSEGQKKILSRNVKAAINRIQLFQTANGGFSYWPGSSGENEWGTNYAGHFMLEAENRGYALPGSLKSNWMKYQREQAQNWSEYTGNSVHQKESQELTQAYRLFVLALGKKPETGSMNRLRENKALSKAAKWRLAAAYELIGQHDAAKKLVQDLPTEVAEYRDLSQTFGSDIRDKAMMLETAHLLGMGNKATVLLKDIASVLNSKRWMSTQETAYSLLAIANYTGASEGGNKITASYKLGGGSEQKVAGSKSITQIAFTEKDFAKKTGLNIKNLGKTKLFAKVMVEGIPLVGDKSADQRDLVMKIIYKDMDGNRIKPDRLAQGKEFVAEVTITNPSKSQYYQEMALMQIFPSGWEIHNARLGDDYRSNGIRYQDFRDDRVYSYYNLAAKQSVTIKVQLNATYLGKFYLPTTYSEAMYDNLINARVPGQWVEVVKENELIGRR